MPGELLHVDVGDLTFRVRADGPDDGRPVLLLHGFPETSLSWAAVTPLLTEEVLLADDARRLRRMLGSRSETGVPEEAIDEYVAILSAPGALTAALNWYRAMSSSTPVERVQVPTTYVWSDGDIAIGRTAAEF